MNVPTLNEDWTEEEAWAAGRLAWDQGIRGPNNPISWWHGKQRLRELQVKCQMLLATESFDAQELKAAVAAGVMRHVIDAIELCAMHEWPIPQWAAQPFRAAIFQLRFFEARSWNDVLGPPPYLPKNAKLPDIRRRRDLQWPVYKDVDAAIKQGRAKEPELFAEIGERHGIGKTLAWELWDAQEKQFEKARTAAD